MSCLKTVREKAKSLWSLVVGLRVTGANYVRPQVTVHYPRRTVDNLATYRGHVELVGKPGNPVEPRCICCMLCVASCPSQCITVKAKKEPKPAAGEGEAPKKAGKKTPETWELDYTLCSLCGTCAEVCPAQSLRYSQNVYLVSRNKDDYVLDLLARLRAQAGAAAAGTGAAKEPESGAGQP